MKSIPIRVNDFHDDCYVFECMGTMNKYNIVDVEEHESEFKNKVEDKEGCSYVEVAHDEESFLINVAYIEDIHASDAGV